MEEPSTVDSFIGEKVSFHELGCTISIHSKKMACRERQAIFKLSKGNLVSGKLRLEEVSFMKLKVKHRLLFDR
jgi:hypothetical protein